MRPPDRQARAAEERYLDDLRRALSCLTTTILIPRPHPQQPMSRTVELARNPTALSGTLDLRLRFFHTYTARLSPHHGDWTIELAAYRYELNDQNDAEILAYHWHPAGQSPITTPHLHLSARHPSINLAKRHLPTGIVTVQTLFRSLITEFGVEPLRADWDDILSDV